MSLLERVSTLIRANLNDLVDKAENPEKMIKQIILDMQNQLVQVKTQVAIALADQQVLEKKQKENEDKIIEWTRKAEMAVNKNQDDLARAAIERSLHYKQLAGGFAEQAVEQKLQAETLRNALQRLQQKMEEAQSKSEFLVAQHRRARTLNKAADAGAKAGADVAFDRMKDKIMREEALGQVKTGLLLESATVDQRFSELAREDEITRILTELKARQNYLIQE